MQKLQDMIEFYRQHRDRITTAVIVAVISSVITTRYIDAARPNAIETIGTHIGRIHWAQQHCEIDMTAAFRETARALTEKFPKEIGRSRLIGYDELSNRDQNYMFITRDNDGNDEVGYETPACEEVELMYGKLGVVVPNAIREHRE